MTQFTNKDIKRFWGKVNILEPDKCWEWAGLLKPKGYGDFWVDHKMRLAHRVVWELTYGDIPVNIMVLHKCNNKKCVNPNHLYLGTAGNNIRDSLEENPTGRGHCRLYEGEIWLIKKLYKGGIIQLVISKMFKVGRTQIQKIVTGKRGNIPKPMEVLI